MASTYFSALDLTNLTKSTTSGTPITAPPGDIDSLDFGLVRISGGAPVVLSMSVIPAIPVIPDPPKTPLPSDIVPLRPAKFLAMKGLDTRLSGCLYYKAIG